MGWFCPRCGQDAGAEGTCPHDGERLAPVSRHDLIGRSLGEYKVLASLGGGSFGSVYRAVHSRSGMLAAIKLLHRPIDDVESQRVIVESRAAAMLSHPNVVQVYDLAATSDRRPYIVMQLLDGTPLADLLSLRMPVGQALSIVGDVLAGLGHAHRRGVVHRDLKPDNIFIAKGRAVIVDFGLAKLISDPRAPSLTATGEALGTPSYMAPEQVRGELADGRADLYAVGCVLFEMLAGHPPFQGSATYAIFDAHLNQPAPSITEHRNDVPPHVVGAIARVLAKDPDARFASAHEMQRALAGTPAPKRRRWPIVAGIAAATAITVAIAIAAVAGSAVEPAGEPVARAGIVPPRLPDEPPLDDNLENALATVANHLAAGTYRRADVIAMRCGFSRGNEIQTGQLRSYTRRMVKMLDEHYPDIDAAVECRRPSSQRRIAPPEPLPDELPRDEQLENSITSVHEQLESGYMVWAAARKLHCELARFDRDEIGERGSVQRRVRGMHRRIGILLEAYHPGVTSTSCIGRRDN